MRARSTWRPAAVREFLNFSNAASSGSLSFRILSFFWHNTLRLLKYTSFYTYLPDEALSILKEEWLGVGQNTWHPNGEYLATWHAASGLWVWDTTDWKNQKSLSLVLNGQNPDHFAWHPNQNWLAIDYPGYPDSWVSIMDIESGDVIQEFPTDITAGTLAWSFDGQYLVGSGSSQNGGRIFGDSYVWDMSTKQFVGTFGILEGSVDIAIHPSQPIIALAKSHATYVNEEIISLNLRVPDWDLGYWYTKLSHKQ